MAVAVLYEGDASTVRYTFNLIDSVTWGVEGSPGITETSLPGLRSPYFFDAKSRKEPFTFVFTLLPTTYQTGETNRGTGTFLDQLSDILYLFREQATIVRTDFPDAAKFWWFIFAFRSSSAVNASHDVGNEWYYGFVSGLPTYSIPCIIKEVKILEIDPTQQHCKVQVTLQRVNTIIGF